MSGRPSSLATVGIVSSLGLIPAALSILLPALLTAQNSPIFVGSSLGIFPGDVFGAMMAVYFVAFAGDRSIAKAIALVVASTFAYYAALFSGMFLGMAVSTAMRLTMSADEGLNAGMVAPLLIAGVLGAFLILATILRLYSVDRSWRAVLRQSAGWSLLGGPLAVVGYGLGPALGLKVWSILGSLHLNRIGEDAQWASRGGAANGYALHFVWQTGMGIVLGFVLSQTQLTSSVPRVRANSARNFGPVNIVLFAAMALALVYLFRHSLSDEYRDVQWQRAFARLEAEKPSAENLPQVAAASPDEMLIVTPIGAYVPVRPGGGQGHVVPMSDPQPQGYNVRYSLPGAPEGGANVGPHVDVHIQEWPNAAWAKWELDQQNFSPSLNHAEYTTKFGNRILLKPEGKETAYAWPSGSRFVIMEVDTADPDLFLKGYLEKYPSAL
jgi:hypothetical protein